MRTPKTHWRVPAFAWAPIALAVAAEATSNALRAYGLASHLERYTVLIQGTAINLAGAVLVLAAIAVSLCQSRAAWVALSPSAPMAQRLVAGLVALLLLTISITAMASHILEAERAKASGEMQERARYDRAESTYQRLAAELAALTGVRSVGELEAAMAGSGVPTAVLRRTDDCRRITRDDSAMACAPLLALRQTLVGARRKHELEHRVAALSAALDRLRPRTRTSRIERRLAELWAWIMGLGIVLVATFGAVLFASADDRAAPTKMRRQCRSKSPGPSTRRVQDWIRTFRSTQGRNPKIPELQAAFPGLTRTTAWRRCRAS
ncbi:MAG: hypothetical protein AB7E70_03010 [Hyphomicrobiaceae bacterium]